MRSQTTSRPARIALTGTALALALMAGACQSSGGGDITGSINPAAAPAMSGGGSAKDNEAAWRAYAEEWGKRYDAKPGDKTASLNYARALRALGQKSQAVAVLQAAVVKSPKDQELLAAFGKALAEDGQFQRAQQVLSSAHTPERPDWRVLSAQGAAADQLGQHQQAQALYETALRIKPDDPGVLSNLGLSYALSQKLPEAETVLRKAAAQPNADVRARQNLSLVLGLQGKFAEAEEVARQDMSAVDAAQSVSSIRSMVSQTNSWSAIKNLDKKSATKAKPGGSAVGSAPMPLPAAPGTNG